MALVKPLHLHSFFGISLFLLRHVHCTMYIYFLCAHTYHTSRFRPCHLPARCRQWAPVFQAFLHTNRDAACPTAHGRLATAL